MSTSHLDEIEFETTLAENWRDHARCHGQMRLFFARKAERPEARERREAKARRLCDTCPVADICREWGRLHHEYGFWGGESEEDRHRAGYTLSAPIGIIRQRQATGTSVTAC